MAFHTFVFYVSCLEFSVKADTCELADTAMFLSSRRFHEQIVSCIGLAFRREKSKSAPWSNGNF